MSFIDNMKYQFFQYKTRDLEIVDLPFIDIDCSLRYIIKGTRVRVDEKSIFKNKTMREAAIKFVEEKRRNDRIKKLQDEIEIEKVVRECHYQTKKNDL